MKLYLVRPKDDFGKPFDLDAHCEDVYSARWHAEDRIGPHDELYGVEEVDCPWVYDDNTPVPEQSTSDWLRRLIRQTDSVEEFMESIKAEIRKGEG